MELLYGMNYDNEISGNPGAFSTGSGIVSVLSKLAVPKIYDVTCLLYRFQIMIRSLS